MPPAAVKVTPRLPLAAQLVPCSVFCVGTTRCGQIDAAAAAGGGLI